MSTLTAETFYKHQMRLIAFFNQFSFASNSWKDRIPDLITKGFTVESIKNVCEFTIFL